MIDTLLSYIAPHLCCGCAKIGTLLCDDCKYDIINEPYVLCVLCGKVANSRGVCNNCNVPFTRAWCVGERSGVLQRIIGLFKFQNTYAAAVPLSQLLSDTIGQLPPDTIVVPIPTVASHIRERGYDHAHLIAKGFARRRRLKLQAVIIRKGTARQRGASRSQRLAQAKVAFEVRGDISSKATYLLIDDVMTTGATITYAAEALRRAGATAIWVGIIARQPLD